MVLRLIVFIRWRWWDRVLVPLSVSEQRCWDGGPISAMSAQFPSASPADLRVQLSLKPYFCRHGPPAHQSSGSSSGIMYLCRSRCLVSNVVTAATHMPASPSFSKPH
ncbi:hypothetical protein MRX96_001565 [Rhipicephalus microplus]